VQGADLLSQDVDHAVPCLNHSLHHQQRLQPDQAAVLFIDLWPDDDVDQPVFILQRQEDHPFGRARSLPGDDIAGQAHPGVVAQVGHLGGLDRSAFGFAPQ